MAKAILAAAALFVCLTAGGPPAEAQYVGVDGYFRSNGAYVSPHVRTYPDGNPYNNLGRR